MLLGATFCCSTFIPFQHQLLKRHEDYIFVPIHLHKGGISETPELKASTSQTRIATVANNLLIYTEKGLPCFQGAEFKSLIYVYVELVLHCIAGSNI